MKKSYVAIFHIVFWLPYLFQRLSGLYMFYSMRVSYRARRITIDGESSSLDSAYYIFTSLNNVFLLTGEMLIFYIFYFYLFPSYINNQQIKRFLVVGLVVSLGITVLNIVSQNVLLEHYKQVARIYHLIYNGGFGFFTSATLFLKLAALGITACMLRGFISWYNDIRYKKELENRNLQTELALLKAQINPHFLFNTLNNIDILIEKNAEAASVYLKKLSDLLRFTLYESPAETIPLSREIAGIEQYIDLQRIRTSNPNFVKFEVKGNIDELYIAPMIFMPFVENAFKHSTNKKVEDGIEILININNDEINFSCVNVFDDTQALEQPNSGLGLDLINSRLNLFYQGNHALTISKENNLFSVNLMIRADDH
jgi:two-component system LytT family sensor kinase